MASVTLVQSPVYGLPMALPSATAYNDPFNVGTLRPWWVNPLTSAAGQGNTITFGSKGMSLFGAGSNKHVYGIRQKSPPASFTVMGYLASLAVGSGTDVRAGIYVAVTGAKGNVCGPFQQDGAADAIGVTTVSDTADWSGYDSYQGSTVSITLTAYNWFRIVWSAAGSSIVFAVSTDNQATWTTIGTRTSMSQPTEMGLCIYSNSGVVGSASYGLGVGRFVVTTP